MRVIDTWGKYPRMYKEKCANQWINWADPRVGRCIRTLIILSPRVHLKTTGRRTDKGSYHQFIKPIPIESTGIRRVKEELWIIQSSK